MSFPVQITSIAPITSEKTLHDFFSFCGKIEKIDFNPDTKSATIYFEKVSAAKTALMLNGGALDGANLTVTSTAVGPDHVETPGAGSSGEHISQEDKPRSGIVAEYLAKGYELSEPILQRAIEMDKKNGISERFLSYIKSLDQTLGSKIAGPETTLSEKAINTTKTLDSKHGITTRANTYYEKAFTSPWGQKAYAFYSTTSKQVFDIHEEAQRIKATHKAAAAPPPPAAEAEASTATADVKTTIS